MKTGKIPVLGTKIGRNSTSGIPEVESSDFFSSAGFPENG